MEEIRAYKRRENPICFLPTHHLMFNKVCCSHSDLEVIGVFCMPVCLCLLCKLRINSSSIRLVLLLKCLSSLCNFLYQRYTLFEIGYWHNCLSLGHGFWWMSLHKWNFRTEFPSLLQLMLQNVLHPCIYKLETLILGICWARHSIFLKQTFSRYFLFSNTTL